MAMPPRVQLGIGALTRLSRIIRARAATVVISMNHMGTISHWLGFFRARATQTARASRTSAPTIWLAAPNTGQIAAQTGMSVPVVVCVLVRRRPIAPATAMTVAV